MEQVWLALAISAGVAFGFLIAWMSLRSERANIYTHAKSEGEQNRAALEERLQAREARIQELQDERKADQEVLESLRQTNAELRAAQAEVDNRVELIRQEAGQRAAAVQEAHDKLVETIQANLNERIQHLQTGNEALRQELELARQTAEQLRKEVSLLSSAGGPDLEQLSQAQTRASEAAAQLEQARQELESLRAANARAEAAREAAAGRIREQEVRLADLTSDVERTRAECDKLRGENTRLQASCAELEARVEEMRRLADTKLAAVTDAHARLAETVKAASAEALQTNNEAFVELAKAALQTLAVPAVPPQPAAGLIEEAVRPLLESIGRVDAKLAQIEGGAQSVPPHAGAVLAQLAPEAIEDAVRPLRESLERVDAKLAQIEQGSQSAVAGLAEQVSVLLGALRPPAIPAQWGEIQLRRLVESAGLDAYCEFNPSVEGGRRPDAMLHLPGLRYVAIDASAPLQVYLESIDIPDPAGREQKWAAYASALREHLDRLSSLPLRPAPEFSVCFLPTEASLGAALHQDPSLVEVGIKHRVFLATPATLAALFHLVAHNWQNHQLAENAREVSSLGQTLYERLRMFTSQVDDLRHNLVWTVNSYNKIAGTLETRILPSARRFADLGAADGKEIETLEVVDSVPRSLQALESAAGASEPAVADAPGSVMIEMPVADEGEPEQTPASA